MNPKNVGWMIFWFASFLTSLIFIIKDKSYDCLVLIPMEIGFTFYFMAKIINGE
jgi:hypothetical protein